MSTIKVGAIQGLSASSDAITLANDGTCTANITNNLSNRNKIINGAMNVHQRSSSVTGITGSGYQTADRFQMVITHGTWTNTISTDTPDGFASSFKLDCTTADTSVAAGDVILFRQVIEGQNLQDFAKGTSSAKKITVSFYLKTNKTGTYVLELFDGSNNRHVAQSYTVSNSNWNRYTISFPADTTGAFANDNSASLYVQWWLAAGTNWSSGTMATSWQAQSNTERVGALNVNIADSTSNEWLITGVQLEVDNTGSGVATDFEHRSYGQELALCQRYFYKPDIENSSLQPAYQYHANHKMSLVEFPTTMRATPTSTVTWANTTSSFTQYNSSTSHFKAYNGSAYDDTNSFYISAFQASAEL